MIEMQILPDIPRIYTALAEWLACMLCLLEVRRRITGIRFVCASAAVLLLQSLFLALTPGLDGILWIICMTTAAFIMYVFIFFCSETSCKDAAYYSIRAFVLAEFAASLEWQIHCYVFQTWPQLPDWLGPLLLIFVFGMVYIICGKLYRHHSTDSTSLNITNRELISYVIIGLAIFSMSNIGFVSTGTLFGGHYAGEIYNVRTLVDLGGVAIMYAYHVQRVELRIRHELESVQGILHNQYVQYKQARDAMDMINYKYHDLKHHIIALRAEENAENRNEYLDQMEEEIQGYKSQYRTGNNTIDVMLSTKALYCQKHQITLTCVVDGTLFEFMNTMDICSIFGNALDNAIECELKIPDKEKRLIHVSAYAQKNFLIIHFENYYEGEVNLGEDLPETTKEDPRFHGYGLKSLRYTVTKYNGAVDLSTKEQWFHLKILIPLQNNNT